MPSLSKYVRTEILSFKNHFRAQPNTRTSDHVPQKKESKHRHTYLDLVEQLPGLLLAELVSRLRAPGDHVQNLLGALQAGGRDQRPGGWA